MLTNKLYTTIFPTEITYRQTCRIVFFVLVTYRFARGLCMGISWNRYFNILRVNVNPGFGGREEHEKCCCRDTPPSDGMAVAQQLKRRERVYYRLDIFIEQSSTHVPTYNPYGSMRRVGYIWTYRAVFFFFKNCNYSHPYTTLPLDSYTSLATHMVNGNISRIYL